MKKVVSLLLVLVLLCPALAFASQAAVAVTDMMGRAITLDAPAKRVVALDAADCEILYALGAGDTLVGRGEYCDYPQEVVAVPSVQSGYEMNLEQIIALEPEVILMSIMAQSTAQVEALEKAGIKVVTVNAQDVSGVYQAIELIAALTGKADAGAALVADMQAQFAALEAQAKDIAGKTVYFEVSPLQYGLWTAGKNTFMDEIAQLLGLKNCFADVDGWAAISEEQVIERNPDYIVTISMYYGEGPTPAEEILARAGWDTITAVKENRVLNLQNNELTRPSPRLTLGAKALLEFAEGK